MAIVFHKNSGRPSNKPSNSEVMTLYKTHTATEIAEMYHVKPSTVRAWVCRIRKVAESNE